jgi:hypothetical protein
MNENGVARMNSGSRRRSEPYSSRTRKTPCHRASASLFIGYPLLNFIENRLGLPRRSAGQPQPARLFVDRLLSRADGVRDLAHAFALGPPLADEFGARAVDARSARREARGRPQRHDPAVLKPFAGTGVRCARAPRTRVRPRRDPPARPWLCPRRGHAGRARRSGSRRSRTLPGLLRWAPTSLIGVAGQHSARCRLSKMLACYRNVGDEGQDSGVVGCRHPQA